MMSRSRVELADLPSMDAEIRRRSFGFNRRPGARSNRGRISEGGGASSPFAPLISLITQASGCQLAFDSDYCPGAVDGSPVTAVTNRSGSNAVFDSVNNWGHGAITLPTWRATGWGRTQSCLDFVNTAMRFTGSDISGCISGTGKLWHTLTVYQPVFLATSGNQTTTYPGGFCDSAGTQFANGALPSYFNVRTSGTVPQILWQGKPAANVADGVRCNWVPTVFEMRRPSVTTIQSAFNGRVSTAVTFGSGATVFNANGFYVGAWANVTNDGVAALQRVRATFVWDRALTAPELATMYGYCRTYYRGFDWQLGLGAS